MKYKMAALLLFLPFFLTCNITSPYIDVLSDKIEQDRIGDVVTSAAQFFAEATGYDSVSNLGTISLNWENPVVTTGENEAVFLYVRGEVSEQPQEPTDGFEIYHGDLSVNQIEYNNVLLGERYHFGIWAQDANGNLSDPVYAQASVQLLTLNVTSDLHYETTTPSVNNTDPELYAGLDGFTYTTLIQFDTLSVTKIIRADLKLFTAVSGSTGSVLVSLMDESWNEVEDATALSGKQSTLYYNNFGTSSAGSWSEWDITNLVQSWEQVANYGIKIEAPSKTTAARFRSSENGAYPPVIEAYYHLE